MSSEPLFRLLRPEEAGEFRRLRLEALERHPRFFGTLLSEARGRDPDWFRAVVVGRQEGDGVFGAFVDGVVVGIAAFRREEGALKRHRGMLQAVYVQPAHRGGGLAEGLIRALIAHARRHVDLLTGYVTAENRAARAFYLRLGFEITGVERKMLKFGDDHIDEEILVMDFTEASARA